MTLRTALRRSCPTRDQSVNEYSRFAPKQCKIDVQIDPCQHLQNSGMCTYITFSHWHSGSSTTTVPSS
jgi:hypothetical protein